MTSELLQFYDIVYICPQRLAQSSFEGGEMREERFIIGLIAIVVRILPKRMLERFLPCVTKKEKNNVLFEPPASRLLQMG